MLHLEKQQSLPDPKESARGIIRLPPDAMSGSSGTTTATTASAPGVVASGSSSSDWRAHPRDQPSSNHHFHSHHSHSHQVSQNFMHTTNFCVIDIFYSSISRSFFWQELLSLKCNAE